MIQAKEICLSFSNQKVFDHISFTINKIQKVGLVGKNGSGKSTLLKAIANKQDLDSGEISTLSSCKIAYMPQDVVLQSTKSILSETFSAFEQASNLSNEIEKIEKDLTNNSIASNSLIEKYANLRKEYIEIGAEALLAETKKMLLGLGFSDEKMKMQTNSLSVGWKMRLVLAKLLLQKADFYLFDEPTNHLDLISKEWFINFLKKSDFGFILVSHDQYFLDEACSDILELSAAKSKIYRGNYSAFLAEKEKNEQMQEEAFRAQQKEIAQKMATIDRFRYKASKAKMAQSMLKSVEKIERITLEQKSSSVKIKFPSIETGGRIVLSAENLSFAYDNKKIFENISFTIERGEKVAIIAPNGCGKSTLFNVLSGKLASSIGSYKYGLNIKNSIFAQDQNKDLNPENSIFEEVEQTCSTISALEIRSLLGAFLFKGDDVNKKIKVLSGGEKNRVSMVKVLLRRANFLMLDEPTNHLDLESKEVLLQALLEYSGTILFVSHDRNFINKLATRILELSPKEIISYSGNYDYYLLLKNQSDNKKEYREDITISQKIETTNRNKFELTKAAKKLEAVIEKLEKELDSIKQLLQIESNADKISQLCLKYDALDKELSQKINEWEETQERLS